MTKNALILGVTGQDGSYLSKFLIDLGFTVFGTTRNALSANTLNLKRLGVEKNVKLLSTSITDSNSLILTLEQSQPNVVFHMAGLTSVSLSFQSPYEAIQSISISTLNLIEAIKIFNTKIKLFLPCSSDCFGNTTFENPANESSPHNPHSPYAVAKSSSYWIAKSYRDSYGMFISVGFLSNHESPLRGNHFVTSKIIKGIKSIKNNEISELRLGNLNIVRDWGWAPSYIEAIYKIINYEIPDDFIIATGNSYSLKDFVNKAFELSGLGEANKYINLVESEIRPNEIKSTFLNPSKSKIKLNWEHKVSFESLITNLLNENLF
tara:strand:+ start:1427 stop:2389 length:963 start_codon:yes stop_codon:yes gene_type:complete